jgi:mRNA-degrading endonuclease RelE of RelBE toxin-antitoxin system
MYEIIWSDEALEDFEGLHVRHQRAIRVAVEELRHQPAATPTLHRKPLAEPIDELGDLAWQLQIGPFRAFFAVDEEARIVTVLRVILKGRWTTLEALRRSRRS